MRPGGIHCLLAQVSWTCAATASFFGFTEEAYEARLEDLGSTILAWDAATVPQERGKGKAPIAGYGNILRGRGCLADYGHVDFSAWRLENWREHTAYYSAPGSLPLLQWRRLARRPNSSSG